MVDVLDVLQVVSPVLASLVSGYCVLLSQRAKKVETKLLQAYKDIRFYQEVEKVHIEMNVGREGLCNKKKVRGIVRKEFGIDNSGLAPSQVDRAIAKLKGLSVC